eukprot:2205417-Amphidinium_carterae.1
MKSFLPSAFFTGRYPGLSEPLSCLSLAKPWPVLPGKVFVRGYRLSSGSQVQTLENLVALVVGCAVQGVLPCV